MEMRFCFVLKLLFPCFLLNLLVLTSNAQNTKTTDANKSNSASSSEEGEDSLVNVIVTDVSSIPIKRVADSVNMGVITKYPYISLQQMLKGNVAGVYVQDMSGEPGATQSNIFIRGSSVPLINRRDVYASQPTVFVNGLPLTRENPFAFDIQQYDYNRIGTATNLLAGIDMDNIESIEVLKNPGDLAEVGPWGANGVIWITTKNAQSAFRKISLNAYVGMVQRPKVTTTNANDENNFRQPFYAKYGTISDALNYPGYLGDSTNSDYYGPSNWTDLYYKNAPVYNVDMSITGGSPRANFRFMGSATTNKGNADNTGLNKYHAFFAINMLPLKWLTVSSMIDATRMERKANTYLRDRFAETRYLPDLTNPLSPYKSNYQAYLNQYSKSIDDNATNLINGSFLVSAVIGKFNWTTKLAFDYNEGTRDLFFPSTLMDDNNFLSNYFGYNQRLYFDNVGTYKFELNENHTLDVKAGITYTADLIRYNYAYAYNSPNDFIKLSAVNGNSNDADYLTPADGFKVYRFIDKEKHRVASVFGKVKYAYKNLLNAALTLRYDGSSNAQQDNRWLFTPILSAEGNLKEAFQIEGTTLSGLKLVASAGRFGRFNLDDRFAAGPQYRVDMGWPASPAMFSYNAYAGLSRPYTDGWVGYGLKWAYNDQLSVGVRSEWLKGRLNADVDFYIKEDKDMIFAMPVVAESGYTSKYMNGLGVQNTGVDVSISADILRNNNGLSWQSQLNFNYNKNKLKSLPNGANQVVAGDKLLKVGESTDAFWLLENKGIYNTDAEVPVNPGTGKRMNFNGVDLYAGDAKWRDVNGDYVIDDNDKKLIGNSLPKFTGGFSNTFQYKNFDLSFQFYFALGHKILNQYAASRMDFINNEGKSDMSSVKEITYWQKDFTPSDYPMYNPWSGAIPYRAEQDLFLEDASFVKLRSIALGYDLVGTGFMQKYLPNFRRAYVYLSAVNLFTISSFSGRDPELVDFNGYYTGYGLPLPRTFTFGIRLDF